MRFHYLALLALSLTTNVFADANLPSISAPPQAFAAVISYIQNATANQHPGIQEIRATKIYRCPGCYAFEVRMNNKVVNFGTSGHYGNNGLEYTAGVSGGNIQPESAKTLDREGETGSCKALGRVGGEDIACAKYLTKESCEDRNHWAWCAWEK